MVCLCDLQMQLSRQSHYMYNYETHACKALSSGWCQCTAELIIPHVMKFKGKFKKIKRVGGVIYWNYLLCLSIMRLFGRYLLNCWTFCNSTWCTGASLWNRIVMCKVGLLSSRWQWRFGFSQNDYFSICPVSSELLSLLQPKPQRAWSKCSAVQMNIDFGLVCWCIFMCHVKSWNVQGQVHSEGSNPQWMFFHPISSKPLNSLWWNFISWCCINTPSLYQ